jgi:signal transduction histidine kinase
MHPFDLSQYYFNPHALPLFMAVGLIGLLGWKVVASRRSKANLYFGAICLAIITWLFFTALGYLVRDNERLALFWFQLDWIGVSYISISVYAFVVHFLGKDRPLAIKTGYGLGSFFCLLTLTTNPMMIGVKKFPWGVFVQRDVHWSFFFFLFFFGYMVATFAEMIVAYRETRDPVRRNLIKYVLTAFSVAYLGSIDFLPTYGLNIYPWGFAAITAFVAITSYAILRHHLMDINIVIRKTLLYSVVSAGLTSIYVAIVTLLARLVESGPNTAILLPADIFRWFSGNPKLSFAYSCIATAAFSVWFGSFVLRKDPRKKINVLWCLFCLAVADWSFGQGMLVRSASFAEAYFWTRWVHHAGAIMIPALFFHFVASVMNLKIPRTIWLHYVIAAVLLVMDVSGSLMTVKLSPPFTYFASPLPNYRLFVAYFFGSVIYAHGLMLAKIRQTHGRERIQLIYLFVGTAIGFCGGSTTFFPAYNIPIFPFGAYAVPVYIGVIGYAIFKHQLMDIRIVVRKTLLYSLISAVLVSVYVGTITLVAQVWGGRHGSASVFSSALAAIFITLLFNPIRIRTQRWVDSRFPHEHIDPDLLQEAAGGFAHEMKRPLTKISMPAQLLLMELERVERGEQAWKEFVPELKKKLSFIVNQSQDAGYVIEAIRELSAKPVPFEPVNIRLVIEGALSANKDLLEKHGVAVSLQLPADPPAVSGRPKQLEIVFINLIKNAAEALSDLSGDQKREISFEGRSDHGYVTIRVTDTGPGINPEEVGKIFHVGHTTKGKGGTGLGLYLSQQIIQAHNGTIEVSSQPGHGTTFTIRLPVST